MPELPDIVIYREALRERTKGATISSIKVLQPYLLRSVHPPIESFFGKVVTEIRTIGKQIVLQCEGELYLVFHLMIAGRFHWKELGSKSPARSTIARVEFSTGTLLLSESSTKKRASLHCVEGEVELQKFNRGGIDVSDSSLEQFKTALMRERHTLKRTLTDPRLFSGIGNAYSDEILHAARLSPLQHSVRLSNEEVERLHRCTRAVMTEWVDRLRRFYGKEFPEKVTAFREEMAVHGKYGKPCPVCGTAIQRIVYTVNECNYCPRCQTGGRLLSDRAFSKLLRDDWPKTIEELEGLTRLRS